MSEANEQAMTLERLRAVLAAREATASAPKREYDPLPAHEEAHLMADLRSRVGRTSSAWHDGTRAIVGDNLPTSARKVTNRRRQRTKTYATVAVSFRRTLFGKGPLEYATLYKRGHLTDNELEQVFNYMKGGE